MGPVHENDTMVRVSAMKNMPPIPATDDLRSAPVLQPEGSVISNRPKNESANATSMMKNMMFTMALVESAFRALAPNISVMASPNAT